jgi:hypothetical protein
MNPKSLAVTVLIAVTWLGALFVPTPSGGQTADEINTVQLLNDITAQQVTIADNQAKIDAKLASIGENIRQARIYAGRGR